MAFAQQQKPNSMVGRVAEDVAQHEERNNLEHGRIGEGPIERTAEGIADRQAMKYGTNGGYGGVAGAEGVTTGGISGVATGANTVLGAGGFGGVAGIRSEIAGEGPAYCPNPNEAGIAKEFETRVQVIEKVPEMKTVTKVDYVKRLDEREEVVVVPKTKVVMEEVERIDMVPQVQEVTKVRTELRHRVVEEAVEVPYVEKQVVQVPVPRVEQVPRVITEQVEEVVRVPVVTEVPVERQIEVPTGNYCEVPVNDFTHSGKALPTGLYNEPIPETAGVPTNVPLGDGRSTAVETTGLGVGSGVGTGIGSGVGTGTGVGTGIGSGVGTGVGTTGVNDVNNDGYYDTAGPAGTGASTGLAGNTGTTGTGTTGTTGAPKKMSFLQKLENKILPGHRS
jgi:hypothetical protein